MTGRRWALAGLALGLVAAAVVVFIIVSPCAFKGCTGPQSVRLAVSRTFVARGEAVAFRAEGFGASGCATQLSWNFGQGPAPGAPTIIRSFKTLGHRHVVVQARGCGNTVTAAADMWVVAVACPDGKPFDLVWNDHDANQLPLNPQWRWQCDYTAPTSGPATSGYLDANTYCNRFAISQATHALDVGAGCSSQISGTDEPTDPLWYTICHFITTPPWGLEDDSTVHGHVNWNPSPSVHAVAYDGTVTFQQVQKDFPSGFGDGDADLDLIPSRANLRQTGTRSLPGITAENPDHIHIEFYAPEVLQAFSDSKHANTWANALIHLPKNAPAVVIGQMGLDVRHGSYSEVHPIYAFAVQEAASPGMQRWLFFARNGGTEGGCSNNSLHPFTPSGGAVIITLPVGSSEQLSTPSSYSLSNNAVTPDVRVTRTDPGHIAVTVSLLPPTRYDVVAGEFEFASLSRAALAPAQRLARSVPSLQLAAGADAGEPENLARSLALLLPPQQSTAAFRATIKAPTAPRLTAAQACVRLRALAHAQERTQPTQTHLVQEICRQAHLPF